MIRALESPDESVLVNLLGVALDDRPSFLASLLPHIQHLRNRTGRPHWLIVDEAHHLLPTSWSPVEASLPRVLENTILITVHPEQVAKPALQMVDVVLGIGDSALNVFVSYAEHMQVQPPQYTERAPKSGEALAWFAKIKTRYFSRQYAGRGNASAMSGNMPKESYRRNRVFSFAARSPS